MQWGNERSASVYARNGQNEAFDQCNIPWNTLPWNATPGEIMKTTVVAVGVGHRNGAKHDTHNTAPCCKHPAAAAAAAIDGQYLWRMFLRNAGSGARKTRPKTCGYIYLSRATPSNVQNVAILLTETWVSPSHLNSMSSMFFPCVTSASNTFSLYGSPTNKDAPKNVEWEAFKPP